MFNKLKHLKDLRNQAKTMQNALAQENINIDKGGITITMNGNLEISNITIAKDMSTEAIEKAMVNAINEAIKKAQRVMATKMQEMGGIPGLS